MKSLVALLLLLVATSAFADQYVNGYTRKDGTYVNGYTRSSPDSSYNNNYNVRGNTNPYTGSEGTASPTYNDRSPSYNTRTYGDPGYTNSGSGNSTGRSNTRSIYGY
ncbi:hypothetical protein Gbem_1748 [Citrifermentans bemidjiense Bem]|uniref:Uncharacterized protein n=1 Tax=Citrifermentans bemidjiense (strain ATCC BAA-1014 / DSM 16622 / JCM 12645 / Bem) TaxID=404380 RepID=B5EA58_CITBB|nr:hypothetical protein [Citrifermentans bemidjiense]ACH38764.1 hypothetical protein Gbem_1748 [Citrifermentans bemidjiense Bem]